MNGSLDLGRLVMFAQSAIGTSMIAFGGLNWALDGAAAPVAAVLRLEPAMEPAGPCRRARTSADGRPAREIRFRNLTFAYPGSRNVARRLRPDNSCRHVAGHRRTERRRQNDAGQAALPLVRPARAGRSKSTASISASFDLDLVAIATDGRVPGFHAIRAAAPRQRRAGGRSRCGDQLRARSGRRGESRDARYDPRPRIRRGNRTVGRAVAARRTGPRTVCRDAGSGRRAAR